MDESPAANPCEQTVEQPDPVDLADRFVVSLLTDTGLPSAPVVRAALAELLTHDRSLTVQTGLQAAAEDMQARCAAVARRVARTYCEWGSFAMARAAARVAEEIERIGETRAESGPDGPERWVPV